MNNQNIVEIRNLEKRYGQKQVLHGINLEITSGQIIGYIGPNGAGKSTTVKILCGLINEFDGDINIFGKDLRTNTLEIKKRVGYIPENAVLYESLTPMEFMEFIGEMRGLENEVTRSKAFPYTTLFRSRSIDEHLRNESKSESTNCNILERYASESNDLLGFIA